jgi:hypothetical protein
MLGTRGGGGRNAFLLLDGVEELGGGDTRYVELWERRAQGLNLDVVPGLGDLRMGVGSMNDQRG